MAGRFAEQAALCRFLQRSGLRAAASRHFPRACSGQGEGDHSYITTCLACFSLHRVHTLASQTTNKRRSQIANEFSSTKWSAGKPPSPYINIV